MRELKTTNFIKSNKEWRNILTKKPYCIEIKEDQDYILLKYRLIDGPDFSLEIVRECRGIILRKLDFKPVCVPFFKFGNYGEEYVPNIDWESAKVLEKIDGSLIKVWHDGHWRISTNGTIDASKAEIGTSVEYKTFEDLFLKAVEKLSEEGVKVFDGLNKDYTYMFELVSPYNMQVVNYDEIKIYHIGTRNNITFEELDLDIGVEKPKEYKVNLELNELIKLANTFKTEKEGFVVVDKYWNRVKIKSEDYVKAHYLNSGNNISDKKLLEIIISGEEEEFLNYLPKYQERLNEIKVKLNTLTNCIDKEFKEFKKNVAIMIKTCEEFNYKSYLFSKIDNNKTATEYLKELPTEKVYKLILGTDSIRRIKNEI